MLLAFGKRLLTKGIPSVVCVYVLKFYCSQILSSIFLGWLYAEANMNVSNVSVTQKFNIFACPTVTGLGDLIRLDVYRSGASSLELTGFVRTWLFTVEVEVEVRLDCEFVAICLSFLIGLIVLI